MTINDITLKIAGIAITMYQFVSFFISSRAFSLPSSRGIVKPAKLLRKIPRAMPLFSSEE